jgi:hypothetical protein
MSIEPYQQQQSYYNQPQQNHPNYNQNYPS